MIDRSLAVFRDLGLAVGSLRRAPGFTSIAVVTLALGIGANTSMFSILNGYVLLPAPYPESDRLDRIYRATAERPWGGVSPADYLELRAQMEGYGAIAAYAGSQMSLAAPGEPAEMVEGVRVSADLFSTLGSEPVLGRSFRAEEEILGNHRVAILNHRYWQDRFGADNGIIGRTVRIDGVPHEVVGVLPANFSDWRHLSWVDLFRPLGFEEAEVADREATWVRLVGRRSSDLSRVQAAGFVAGFGERLAADHPTIHGESHWQAVPIEETFIDGSGRNMLLMLVGLSGFVLLIACSNLANLLLARTMARARELALRAALGASRGQLLRPLFAEALVVALLGGLCAIPVALWAFEWLEVASAGDGNVGVELALDWNVLGWVFGACLFTALAFGVAPALFALRLDPHGTLKSGGRGTTGDRGHRRFRHLLVVAQFALAMVLLAGAALFASGLYELNNRRHGWESDHLVTASVVLPATTYESDQEVSEFQRLAVDRLEALPGVSSASLSYAMPFFGLGEARRYLVAGREAPEGGREPAALTNGVSPRYFETVGTRLLEGRAFDSRDGREAPRVFIVNQAMARGLFGEESPIGQRIARVSAEMGSGELQWGEIVGVAADVESVFPEPAAVRYQLYQPLAQEPRRQSEIAVRTAGVPPAALVEGIRTSMAALDPDLPLRRLQPAATTIARVNYQLGVLRTVLSALAVLGLALACLGVYGVIARTVAHRKGELAIRMALGARAGEITRLVLGSGARLALVGTGVGLVGAIGVSRLMAAGFPEMRIASPAVLVGVMLLLIAVAQVASYLPARQASRTDPARTLWAE